MSKIHKKTGSVCLICDKPYKKSILLHKTQRQTHRLCIDCGVDFLKPILKSASNKIRKNIRKDVDSFKCPGGYHSETRNKCTHIIKLSDLDIPTCEISEDAFRVGYCIYNDYVYMCPEEKCDQLIESENFVGNMLQCYRGCGITWCKNCLCKPYHIGKSCIEHKADQQDIENATYIWEMIRLEQIKFCPQCNSPTFKYREDNKIICSTCNIKWCWICSSTDNDCFN